MSTRLQMVCCGTCFMSQRRNANDGNMCQHHHPTLGAHAFVEFVPPPARGFSLQPVSKIPVKNRSAVKRNDVETEAFAQRMDSGEILESRAVAFFRF